MAERNSHCSWCGAPFTPNQAWPRQCASCQNISYLNPLPVAVALVPILGQGLLVVRRGIPPKLGELALPGGFIDFGETWQQACAREVFEETQLQLDPAHVSDHCVLSTPSNVLVFGLFEAISPDALPPFTPTSETTERAIISHAQELAFPLHTEAVKRYFDDPKH